jgi:G3E family GTPase
MHREMGEQPGGSPAARPLLSHFVRLDAIVTTVDAVNGAKQLDEHEEAVKQAALADRLLLTKTDLAESSAYEGLRERLRRLNPGAEIVTVSHGDIAPDRLFGAALFDAARKTPDVRRWLQEEAYAGHAHDHAHDQEGRARMNTRADTTRASAPSASPSPSRSTGMWCRSGLPGCGCCAARICSASKASSI